MRDNEEGTTTTTTKPWTAMTMAGFSSERLIQLLLSVRRVILDEHQLPSAVLAPSYTLCAVTRYVPGTVHRAFQQ